MTLANSTTAVLERHAILADEWATEPYETAWAREAIFFFRIEEIHGQNVRVHARVQISPDGIHWADEGARFDPIADQTQAFVRVTHFGGWLRLLGRVEGSPGSTVQATLHLVLKEA